MSGRMQNLRGTFRLAHLYFVFKNAYIIVRNIIRDDFILSLILGMRGSPVLAERICYQSGLQTRISSIEEGKTNKSLFLFPRTFFPDLVWISSVLVMCTFQVITKLRCSTSHVFSSEWRGSCDVVRIKYIHVIFFARQAVLTTRLVFREYWVLTVTATFRQRKRKL